MSGKVKGWPWVVLDLSGTPASTAEVRRAYAKKLKTIDQAKDIAGFEALREAYEAALARTERKAKKSKSLVDTGEALVSHHPVESTRIEPSNQDMLDTVLRLHEETSALLPTVLEKLQVMLKELELRDHPATAIERARQILGDPEFQTDVMLPQLRRGFARFLISQLIIDHRGKSFLRYSTVPADLLQMLDHRFGWFSDLMSYQRDFGGRADLLDAVLVATDSEPEAEPRFQGIEAFAIEVFQIFAFFALAMSIAATLTEAESRLSTVFPAVVDSSSFYSALACVLAGFGLYKNLVHRRPSLRQWKGIVGIFWAGFGLAEVAFAAKASPTDEGPQNRLEFWVSISLAFLVASLGKWLWRRYCTYLQDRRRRLL